MSVLQYFKLSSNPATTSETGIGAVATDVANAAVQKQLDHQSSKCLKTQGLLYYFCYKTCAEIGKYMYAAEIGNAGALR